MCVTPEITHSHKVVAVRLVSIRFETPKEPGPHLIFTLTTNNHRPDCKANLPIRLCRHSNGAAENKVFQQETHAGLRANNEENSRASSIRISHLPVRASSTFLNEHVHAFLLTIILGES